MITLGSDPEFAFFDPEKGYIPAHAVGIPDRDNKGIPPGGYGKYFRDGFGLEVNPHPAWCVGNHLSYAKRVMREALTYARKSHPNLQLRAPSAIDVDLEKVFIDAPADVAEVGCSPSLNIYKEWGEKQYGMWNPRIHAIRMFAGHLHFTGMGPKAHTREWVEPAIRVLDWLVGVPLTYIFQDEPEVFRRREFYGQAGEYRLQTHVGAGGIGIPGIEYRTPGVELWRHQAVTALFAGIARLALDYNGVENYSAELIKLYGEEFDERVQIAINTGKGIDDMLRSEYHSPWGRPVKKEMIKALRENKEKLEFGPEAVFTDQMQECHYAWPNYPEQDYIWQTALKGIKW